ncbi:MAG: nucleotidyltransferase domain-containing protein [Candidatus Niyogibacteria bacterium]|nr:nucleotidyltransferase domain-containing protein [Candidatus Niyogibacteria bacterium]
MTQEQIYAKINEVAQTIGENFQPEKIILFGSYAWGTPGPDSDVDLFIVKKTDNTREMARQISRLIFPRPFPLDVIVYRPEQIEEAEKKDFFIRDIVGKGRLLYGE